MDGSHFDALTRTLTAPITRRVSLSGLAAGILVALGLALEETTVLAKKKGNKGKGKSKSKKNKKKCSFGRPPCGNRCCLLEETCQPGGCRHRCQDGLQNLGESDQDCGRVCVGLRGENGRCLPRQKCGGPEDCRSGFCDQIASGPETVCVECLADNHCVVNVAGPRCLDNFCFECALDADCVDRFDPPQPVCIFLPVTAGLNTAPCPPNQPCVCRECRNDTDCPAARPRCQTGTGTPADGFCFECLEDSHCPEGQLCDEQGFCEVFVCSSDNQCPSGCCDGGECIASFDSVAHCGSCRNICPGQIPSCVLFCCQETCQRICLQEGEDPPPPC